MVRIFGFGVGVLILSVAWAACVLLCLVFSRRKGFQQGFVYLVLGAIITAALYYWPKEPCEPVQSGTAVALPVDYLGIPRIVFTVLLAALTLYAALRLALIGLVTSVSAKRLDNRSALR